MSPREKDIKGVSRHIPDTASTGWFPAGSTMASGPGDTCRTGLHGRPIFKP